MHILYVKIPIRKHSVAHVWTLNMCRLSLGGPIIPDTKQPALYKIPVLPVGERVLLHLRCTIGACGALSILPYVALPVSMAGELCQHTGYPSPAPCVRHCPAPHLPLPGLHRLLLPGSHLLRVCLNGICITYLLELTFRSWFDPHHGCHRFYDMLQI